jgi:glycosyltransferase involved in cell wall biosynthesis
MHQKIDILIPVLNSKKNKLIPLLNSIAAQESNLFQIANIVIILNPAVPVDGFKLRDQVADCNLNGKKFHLDILTTLDMGVNVARQLGLNNTAGSLVFFFDDDVVLDDPLLIQHHILNHTVDPSLFAVGGFYSQGRHRGHFSRIYIQRQIQWLNEGFSDRTKTKSDYLIGGHFSIKRKILEDTKLDFDTRIKFGSSETEFFLAARRAGLKLRLIKKSVRHEIIDSPWKLIFKSFQQGFGKRYIESKGLVHRPVFRSIIAKRPINESIVDMIFDMAFSWGYFSFDRNYLGFVSFHLKKFSLHLKYQKQKCINYLKIGL